MAGAHGTPVGVRLLGPVQAWRDDDELDLGTAHRRAILAVLAMRANHAVPREELIAAVWGETAPATAAGSVYTYVSALRGALEPSRDRWSAATVLTSAGGGYCLRVTADSVDALRFATLREQTRAFRAGGDSHAELGALRAALDLWHGEAFDGLPGPYAETQRRRLAELRLATIERQATLLLGSAGYDEVIAAIEPLVADHPLRESLHGLLMTALVRRGRIPEALAVYRHAHRTLVEQTGTEPSTALRRLHAQILAGDLGPDTGNTTGQPPYPARSGCAPAARAAAPATEAGIGPHFEGDTAAPQGRGSAPARRTPFVGRVLEMARLRAAVAAVSAGRGGCVWIEGEPGIGKSALLAEGLRDAERRGCRVGRGVGDELAQSVPLAVLMECLDLDFGRGLAGTGALTPAMTGPGPDPAGADPTGAVLDRVQTLVREACADTPLVLVIDDVQWADDASLLAWHSLYRLTARVPLLLVTAGRTVPRGRRLGLLRGVLASGGAELLSVPPLTADETAELVRRTHPDPTLAETLAGPAGRLAAGNPRYLTGILAAAARGPARWLDAPPPAEAARPDPAGALPAALIATVAAHLDLLTEGTRDVVRAAAFLGESATVGELCAVTGRPVPALIGAVQEALSARVLAEIGGEELAFRHPLVRRVLHESTPTALRLMLHREFAEKLATTGSVTRIAEQLLAAGPPADGWAHRWLADHLDVLTERAPRLAADLVGRTAGRVPAPRRPPRRVTGSAPAATPAAGRIGTAPFCYPMGTDPPPRWGQTSVA
jgi:DNA-binding SARP family transcriptional activator